MSRDRNICVFYEKIGACRHGDKCSRKHIKATSSRTIMCQNFYHTPKDKSLTKQQLDEHFEHFVEDIFIECVLLGARVEDFMVSENQSDHLNGNVYIKFSDERMAEKVMENFNGRWYDGRPIYCDLCLARNFELSCCKEHFTNSCARGGMCNFVHSKNIRDDFFEDLLRSQEKSFRNNSYRGRRDR